MEAVVLQSVLSVIQSSGADLNASNVLSGVAPSQNVTPPIDAAATSVSPFQLPALLLALLHLSAVQDWLKIFLVGVLIQSLRGWLQDLWDWLSGCIWVYENLDADDDCGLWLQYWLSKNQRFLNARMLDVSTRNVPGMEAPVMLGLMDPYQERGRNKSRTPAFFPSVGTTYTLFYKCRYMTVSRSRLNESPWQVGGSSKLHIRMLALSHEPLRELFHEAKKLYLASRQHRISIYTSDGDFWRLMSTQPKRSIDSIFLDENTKEELLEDAEDFLCQDTKDWYTRIGIPRRRGYLLHGAPGSGKTSLVHAAASELELDIYLLPLTRYGMDDSLLMQSILQLPEHCIVLIEDIDAIFHHGMRRDIDDPEQLAAALAAGHALPPPPPASAHSAQQQPASRVSLSGLLNVLDGIGAQEGRIVFATTNDFHALDVALRRAGRFDKHIEFTLASEHQAAELFKRFYGLLSSDADDARERSEEERERTPKPSRKNTADAPTETALLLDAAVLPVESHSSSALAPALNENGGPKRRARPPRLAQAELARLAATFARGVQGGRFTVATLQGYLLENKARPDEAANRAAAWAANLVLERSAEGAGTRLENGSPQTDVSTLADDGSSVAGSEADAQEGPSSLGKEELVAA
ncbi:P-loop containing nucleoside triphosphate hydrolase protein [Epithele typhae]|uniref:P-loop containing nucleoside triphosphate hydrolase protein n=1 Tax=Epithele typhae TaxID=378194 RepID=UPI00200778A3|nr:P-loop containing nucleoside triphosphate hydrolase protein [Epithele typhae]KAH9913547.1 P-loop containing nucleoside triphosphate hydrolase protein [Epithele typhae]